jgi:predicted enzyme related to lactoylglutathione lyase
MSQAAPVTAQSALNWFDIPVTDFERARTFYEAIFETALRDHQFGSNRIAVFPYERPGTGGCLIDAAAWAPASGGTVIYLDANGRLERTIALIAAAGGSVVLPKTALPGGMGSIARFIDSEGNLVGLHAMS